MKQIRMDPEMNSGWRRIVSSWTMC